jgi:hypothetical protein
MRTEIPVSSNYQKLLQIWEDRPLKHEDSVCEISSDYPFQGSNTGSNPVGDTNDITQNSINRGVAESECFQRM